MTQAQQHQRGGPGGRPNPALMAQMNTQYSGRGMQPAQSRPQPGRSQPGRPQTGRPQSAWQDEAGYRPEMRPRSATGYPSELAQQYDSDRYRPSDSHRQTTRGQAVRDAVVRLALRARDLQADAGNVISNKNVFVYLEKYLDLKTPSAVDGGAGEWPDPLVPRVDQYAKQKRAAFPFKLVRKRNQPVWVDVYVPPNGNSHFLMPNEEIQGVYRRLFGANFSVDYEPDTFLSADKITVLAETLHRQRFVFVDAVESGRTGPRHSLLVFARD